MTKKRLLSFFILGNVPITNAGEKILIVKTVNKYSTSVQTAVGDLFDLGILIERTNVTNLN